MATDDAAIAAGIDVAAGLATAGAPKKKVPTMGPVRVNLEAFGVAILAAVLLKWFCLEAYQIPTSSMQPTLMGSSEAGVFDRILVDKLGHVIREPQRWDITVFRYPLQKNQNYVKRLVGMPGDRLRIGGGNIYRVEDLGGKPHYHIERKPDDLQELMWKDVYPGRRLVLGESKALGQSWSGQPPAAFREDEDGITIDLDSGNTRSLGFRDKTYGSLVDLVWDGYPTATASAIREAEATRDREQRLEHRYRPEVVSDARLRAVVTPEAGLDELALAIDVQRPGSGKLSFALVVRSGKGRLQVKKDAQVLGESPEFEFDLPAGASTEVGFAHVDDQMIAWHAGTEVQRFDCKDWTCRDGCEPTFDAQKGWILASNQNAVPQFVCKGKGKVRIADIRLDRDQHYTRSTAPEVIEVPIGHYYMMGDNTLQSIDSRGWTAVTVHVLDGKVVPKDTPGARAIRGNKRPMPLTRAPDRDETPIAIPSEHAIVMIDEYGEILRLEGEAAPDWGDRGVVFRKPGAQDGGDEWQAEETAAPGNTVGVSFVPRSDIQGRALMVFYPCRPLSWLTGNKWPGRFGFVR